MLSRAKPPGILGSCLHADGSYTQNAVRARTACAAERFKASRSSLWKATAVFKFAVRVLEEMVEEILAPHHLVGRPARLADSASGQSAHHRGHRSQTRLPMEKVIVTVDRHANTSAASIPLALDEAVRDGRIRSGQHVLLEAVGGGFTWGATLLNGSERVSCLSDFDPEKSGHNEHVGNKPCEDGFLAAHDDDDRPVSGPRFAVRGHDVRFRILASGAGDIRPCECAPSASTSGSWCRTAPKAELNKTINTQPVMLAAGIALFRAWIALGGPAPVIVAGHSLGEYSALVAAGVLDFSEAMTLVRFRAQVMQEAVPEGQGAIAAILGLDDETVRSVCREASDAGVAEAANYNSPGQVVIAGDVPGVQRAIELAKAAGAKRCGAAADERSIALQLDATCGGASARAPCSVALRAPVNRRSSTMSMLRSEQSRCASGTPWCVSCTIRCAGPRCVQAHRRRCGVTPSSNAGRGSVLTGLNRRAAPGIKAVGAEGCQHDASRRADANAPAS